MNKKHFLFLTILIEGYVVLSCELLAIRLLVPFVGSGVEITAIIISGILMPLAVGYHFGGTAFRDRFVKVRQHKRLIESPRTMLLRNIVVAMGFLAFGLSHIFLVFFFDLLTKAGIMHRLIQTGLYTLCFLVWPTFLLGQTVPLISHYFSQRKLSEITGKMLFFSTTGSFLGSLCSTLVLMSFFGVQFTVIVTIGLVFILSLLLGFRKRKDELKWALGFMILVFLGNSGLNSGVIFPSMHIFSNNAYSMVQIIPTGDEKGKIMKVNGSYSSLISADPEKRFEYVKYVNKNFIEPIMKKNEAPRDILVIGAGGFTMGQFDVHNRYVFVDIDGVLKNIAEKYFLPEELTPNKSFVASSARAFLKNDKTHYDLILLDTYTMKYSIPAECITREFFQDIKNHLKPNGVVVANVIESPAFRDKFAVRYHNTFANVFPVFSRQIIYGFDPWHEKEDALKGVTNILYIYFQNKMTDDPTVYTDDRNTYSLDRE